MLFAAPAFVAALAAAGGQRSIARTPDGHPDLQGTYDLGTLTPLERAANMPPALSQAEAAKLEPHPSEPRADSPGWVPRCATSA